MHIIIYFIFFVAVSVWLFLIRRKNIKIQRHNQDTDWLRFFSPKQAFIPELVVNEMHNYALIKGMWKTNRKSR